MLQTAGVIDRISRFRAGLAAGSAAGGSTLGLARSDLTRAIILLFVLGCAVWADYAWTMYNRSAEQRDVAARIIALETQSLAAGSVLACVDGWESEQLAAGCERALFAAPETIAAALSLVQTRLDILASASTAIGSKSKRDPEGLQPALAALRSGLERDQFGLVAQVLAVRHGCTAIACDALRILQDGSRVRANLTAQTFETKLAQYAPGWGTQPAPAAKAGPVASAVTSGAAAPETQPTASPPTEETAVGFEHPLVAKPVSPRFSLPSSDSIPPISIMNVEKDPATPASKDNGGATGSVPATAPDSTERPRRPAARQRRATRHTNAPTPLQPSATELAR